MDRYIGEGFDDARLDTLILTVLGLVWPVPMSPLLLMARPKSGYYA